LLRLSPFAGVLFAVFADEGFLFFVFCCTKKPLLSILFSILFII